MHKRTRFRFGLVVVVVGAFALSGCSTALRQPGEYGDVTTDGSGYYGNFMLGCTGVEPNDDGEYVDTTLQSQNYCKCVFVGLKDNVKFSDVKDFEDEQSEAADGADITVPDKIKKVMNACGDDAKSS